MLIASLWPNAIEAIVNEQDFIKRLQQAYEAKENLSQARRTGNEKLQKDNETALNSFLASPLINQLIDETDLVKLLSTIDTSKSETLAQYLHLAQIGMDASRVIEGSAELKSQTRLEAATNGSS